MDLISRQAAIDGKIHIQLSNGVEIYSDEAVPVDYLRALPSVETVKRGKWKTTPYTDYDDAWECSACGCLWTFIEGTPKDNGANYCPNCGAKMEAPE